MHNYNDDCQISTDYSSFYHQNDNSTILNNNNEKHSKITGDDANRRFYFRVPSLRIPIKGCLQFNRSFMLELPSPDLILVLNSRKVAFIKKPPVIKLKSLLPIQLYINSKPPPLQCTIEEVLIRARWWLFMYQNYIHSQSIDGTCHNTMVHKLNTFCKLLTEDALLLKLCAIVNDVLDPQKRIQ